MRTDELAVALTAATTLIAQFHAAGVLGLADVHTATAVGRMAGEDDEQVLLAVALAVRALRGGSVCVDLATVAASVFEASDEQAVATGELPWPDPDGWVARVAASPLMINGATAPGTRPLRLVETTVYLERYWREEETVREQLQTRRAAEPLLVDRDRLRAGLGRIFVKDQLDPDEPDRQRIAAAVAVLGRVTVLAGGPGTGKTTTVAKLLALLTDQPGPCRIALAAPTGKAAARLAEAVAEATAQLPAEDAARIGQLSAATLHRLLGSLPGERGRFRHHAGHHLPYEVIVVDEMSMVSLPMMARLLEAVRPDARLVLVGDPDQLTSVEAGAVMADITAAATRSAPLAATQTGEDAESGQQNPHLLHTRPGQAPYADLAALTDDGRGLPLPDDITGGVVRLTHTWRFGGAIGDLATAIRQGDDEQVVAIVTDGHDDVRFVETTDTLTADQVPLVRDLVRDTAQRLARAAGRGDIPEALDALDTHRLLCGHRTGPYGVSRWTHEVEHWLDAVGVRSHGSRSPWYPGRPLLITSNDYDLNLFNGDTGVVVDTADGLRAVFPRGSGWVSHAPARLEQVQTVHAMTVHRGQGSQFTHVSFLLPPEDSPLLTRELLYTAVTRATTTVTVVGSLAAIRRAVLRPANRASGLRTRL